MKKKILLLVLLFVSLISNAQDINALYKKAGKAVSLKNVTELKATANSLIKIAPENYVGYLYLAFTSCLENNISSAKKNIETAFNLNYLDASTFAIASYTSFLEGNLEESKKQMDFSYALVSYKNALNITLDDINWIEKATGKNCSQLKEFAKNASKNNPNNITNAQKLYACFTDWQKGNASKNEKDVLSYLSKKGNYGKTAIAVFKFLKAAFFYNNHKIDEAVTNIHQFIENSLVKNNPNLRYQVAKAYNYLSDNSALIFDHKNTLNEANNGLENVQGFITKDLELILLNTKLKALVGLNKRDEIISVANQLLEKAKNKKNSSFEAMANNTLGQLYANSVLPAERNKAFNYLQKAYNLAIKLNDKRLISDVSSNYSIALWQQNKKPEAIEIATKGIKIKKDLKDINGAQLLANNMGYMHYIAKDYNNAIKMFSEAISLSEKHLESANPEMQLALMNEYSSAYSGLIMTYKDTQNVEALFKIQDANRGRLLSKKLHQQAFSKNIIDVQNQLKEEDVLVYYSLLSPGEMVATVITKDKATIKYNFPIDSWLKIKKGIIGFVQKKPSSINNYLIKLDEDIIDKQLIRFKDKKQAFSTDDFSLFTSFTRELMEASEAKQITFLNNFLKQWYSFLIEPIESEILGKKNIIISGEKELNYLPFEAFINSKNQFLLQSHNVTYIPSATIWFKLNERNYSNSRNDLLAFGGATYNDPNTNSTGNLRNKTDYYSVKKELTSKVKTNKNNLSKELDALGYGGANYLPGTLREVENLQKIIPKAKVLVGNDMTESNIKMMNNSGELSNYKWVHIATHGFASDNIPELSGVMLTQNNGEKIKGEDTFLLAHEIEKLTLNADMVTLSACQTALGKIYGGEGINGLNSSLLLAGANNTLLSLWPVNDSGTMVLMTLVYQNMYLKNQTASVALSNAKRTMLSGKVGAGFKSVYMWAPFVLNGSGK
ncbi:CHAT domain-containing protein [Polaribacter haliotis]|uniref:CHAT domain-containing protein n=1 Tax=Polaribacter haliotis TaxID=1888915 RepID=A0A7L8AJD2_9FLAO|nr:CHAT domain-containing protein [Polaribacter haliotis]QOD62112.1 CHAT domain-containing protein [Polaribacter haliotis]